MTEQEYTSVEKAFDKAEQSVVPFVIATDNEITVVGDANETQKNLHDFEIVFRVPQKQSDGTTKQVHHKKEFKDIFITPRQDTKVVKALARLIPFFRGMAQEKGGELKITNLTDEEKMQIYTSVGDEIYDVMYELVSLVLGIDEDLAEYMMPSSVITATAQIIESYPETVNEADTFFG